MNKPRYFLAVILLLIVLIISCGIDNGAESTSEWKGTESAFSEDFDLDDSTDFGTVLVARASSKKYSGNIERNQSGVITEQTYLEGRLSGKSIKKSPDGSWVEVHYVDGQLHGPMTLYSRTGKVRSVINYSNGELVPAELSGTSGPD